MTFATDDPRYEKHESLKQHYTGKLATMPAGSVLDVNGRKIRRVSLNGWSNGGPALALDSMAGWCALYARVTG